MVLRQEGVHTAHSIEHLTESDLPEGDVLVDVDYSSLNFKDALAIIGSGKIVRTWPMIPGVDLAGTVRSSESVAYSVGDQVVLTGWGVGERHWGGYTQRQRVRSEWLVPLPDGLDTKKAMAIGTAGFTAMLCVMRLESAGITPESGKVLVTGAAGGVGSVAISILSNLGYDVTALTLPQQTEIHDCLRELGANEIICGAEWQDSPKPLETQNWSAAIDTVGTHVLARVISTMNYSGVVASCGLAGGADLPITVMPFILRGVSLLGVDSVMCPTEHRVKVWQRVVKDLPDSALTSINRTAALEEMPDLSEKMLSGRLRGRIVVDVNA